MATRKRFNRPIKCEDFDIKKYSYTELDKKNKFLKNAYIAYPRYTAMVKGVETTNSFLFQFGPIKITQGGIPQSTADNPEINYYDTDDKRQFMRIANDPDQANCAKLFSMLGKIDRFNKNPKTKRKIFSVISKSKDIGKMFNYSPLVRVPVKKQTLEDDDDDDDDDDKKDEVRVRWPTCKMKFAINYNSKGIPVGIGTTVFVKEVDDKGSECHTKQDVQTISDLDRIVTWGSTVRGVVMMNKFYADKQEKSAGEKRKFGCSLKLIQLEVTQNRKTSIRQQYAEHFDFDADDEEDDEEASDKADDEEASDKEESDEEVEEPGESEEEADEPEEEPEEEEEEPEEEPEPVKLKKKKSGTKKGKSKKKRARK